MAVTALMSGVSVVGAESFDSVTTGELDASNGNKHLYVNENGINAQAGESNIFVNENGVEITNGLKADSLNATSSNLGDAVADSVTTGELDASNGNKHLFVNENGINAQAGESNIFVNENGVEITNGLKADSLNATSSNLGDAVADSVTTGELDASNGNKHLFVNENGINAQAGESNIFVNENGVEVTNGLKADVVNADSGVVSGDFEVNNGSTNVYVTENGVQLNKGESSLYVDEYGTTVGTNLKVNEDATITGTANVGTLVADTSVVNGDLDVNAGNKHLFVNEENGIQLNAGQSSLYVNENGTRIENGLAVDHISSTTPGTAVVFDDPVMGTEANFENINADKINANDATISGNATVGGTLTANDFKAETGYIHEGAIEHLNSDTITSNSLSVTGDATVTGNLAVGGGLEVGGEVISSNDLKAAGTAGKVIGTAPISVTDSQGNAKNTLTEAVNTNNSMIHENAVAIQNNTNAINSLDSRVDDLGGEIDQVGAISAALAGLHPLDYDGTGSKFQLSAAMGSYDSTQAAAIGAFYHFNRDVMISLGGATSFDGDHKTAGNLGVTFRVGAGASGKAVSDDVMARLEAMDQKIAALEQENKDLKNVLGAIDTSLSKEFPDVPANHWAYDAVTKLAGNDVVAGYPDGEFHGDRTMTRYEMAEIIYKAMNRGVQVDQKLVNEFKPEMEQVAANQNA